MGRWISEYLQNPRAKIETRVSSNRTEIIFGMKRKKRNLVCFDCFSVCFMKSKKLVLYGCFEPVSKQPKQTFCFVKGLSGKTDYGSSFGCFENRN